MGKLKAYWNDKDSNGLRVPVCLVQIYSNKIARMMKRGALVMSPGYPVVLHFIIEFRWSLIYNGHIPIEFLPVEYEDGHSKVEVKEECSVAGT